MVRAKAIEITEVPNLNPQEYLPDGFDGRCGAPGEPPGELGV
jgi:hypothetical protein